MSRLWACVERGTRLNHDGFGDVDAVSARALAAGPREDACVLGLVPQIGLENPQSFERGEVLGEQTSFIVRVIARGDGPREVGKALADPGPEIPVSGPRRQGCSPRTVAGVCAVTANTCPSSKRAATRNPSGAE